MYYCKYCGMTSQNENRCANTACKNCDPKSAGNYDSIYEEMLRFNNFSANQPQDPSACGCRETKSYGMDNCCQERVFRRETECRQPEPNYGCDNRCRQPEPNCGCGMTPPHVYNPECSYPDVPCNDKLQLAFSVVPMQRYCGIMPVDKGLRAGTAFEELRMPYNKNMRRK